MNVAKEPVSEHRSNRWFNLCLEQIKQCRHRVTHGLPSRRDIPGSAQEDEVVSIPGQRARGDDSGSDRWLEQLSVPLSMSGANQRARVRPRNDFLYGCFDQLEGLPIASCG